MELKLYDTLTREKRVFAPIDPARVRMYVCGPTVYDFAHIGNARPVIVFDVLFRLLRHLYGAEHVTYVRNITDVDDKINARAAERGVDIRVLTEETYANFKADVAALGCLEPTVEPRATEYVSNPTASTDMIRLIEKLIASKNAYAAEGHVLFSVATMPDYGKLAKRSLDEMMAGARVEVAPYKRDPMDFVLWKPSPPDLPGWDSPWGRGRPGWHIECSAMSAALLGETFDIHGGGIDLVFPHHENEIAQSRCAFHTGVMANFWMHNGFLQVEGEKMSKSLGNFVTIRELLRAWPGPTIRLAMLTTHYREPLDWTRRQVEQADLELANWTGENEFAVQAQSVVRERIQGTLKDHLPDEFLSALMEDLNTPQAVTVLRRFAAKSARTSIEERQLYLMAEFLGLVRHNRLGVHTRPIYSGALALHDVQATLNLRAVVANGLDEEKEELVRHLAATGVRVKIYDDGWISADATDTEGTRKVQLLVEARNVARKAKNFKESDRIRDELAAMGIELEDRKDGTTSWKVKR